MPNGNEFEIIIGGDTTEISKSLTDLEKDFKELQRVIADANAKGINIDPKNVLREVAKNLNDIKKTNVGSELAKIKPGANQAAQAMTDLSRIAQDAPFGFIAIQNNITPLIESYGRLKAATGSTATALRAMVGSLAGPAGIGLAIGAITAAMVIYEKVTRGSAQATKETNNELKGIVTSISQEAARVAVLVNAIQAENLSRQQRLQAIEELKKINPNYFGQLKDEKDLIDNISGAYAAYTQGLVKAAQSKVFQAKLEKLFEKKIEIELAIDPDSPDNLIPIAKSAGETAADAFRKAYGIKPLSDTLAADLGKTAPLWSQYGAFAGKEIKKAFIRAQPFSDKNVTNKALGDLNNQIDFFVKKITDLGQIKLDPFTPPKNKTTKEGLSLNEIFAKAKEQADKGWQDLIEFSEKQADQYFDAIGKKLADQAKIRKLQDQFQQINDDIRKGIVGFKAGGEQAAPFDANIKALDDRAAILQKLKALGQTPIDVSWLSNASAGNMLLNDQLQLTLTRFQAIGGLVQEFLAPAFNQFFESIFSGTQTAGQALKSFFLGLLKQIAATVAQAAALAAIMSAFGFGGGAGFGALFKSNLGIGPNLGGIGGGNGINFGDVNFSGVLRGADIFLSGQRGGAQIGRIGG